MPTSAPGISSRRGFTLIELLVVLLVMGLVAGLIGSLAQSDERAVLREEAERLSQVLDLAAVESRLTGKRMAWAPDGTKYRFSRESGDAGWVEIGEGSLRARELPPGMAVSDVRIEFDPYVPVAYEVRLSLGEARVSVHAPQ